MSAPREVAIRGDSIRLGQLLKLADLIDNGAEVKPLMVQGLVSVNGEVGLVPPDTVANDP